MLTWLSFEEIEQWSCHYHFKRCGYVQCGELEILLVNSFEYLTSPLLLNGAWSIMCAWVVLYLLSSSLIGISKSVCPSPACEKGFLYFSVISVFTPVCQTICSHSIPSLVVLDFPEPVFDHSNTFGVGGGGGGEGDTFLLSPLIPNTYCFLSEVTSYCSP